MCDAGDIYIIRAPIGANRCGFVRIPCENHVHRYEKGRSLLN